MLAAPRSISVTLGSFAVLALIQLLPSIARAQDFSLFKFNSEGPAPSIGSGWAASSYDLIPPTGSTSGAVQSILVSPTSPNTLFIGTVNGGVWSSTNGGNSWTPLTDTKSSLSIGAMAFKADDSRTIYAGIGLTSNGAYSTTEVQNRGGRRTGILVSDNGGADWRTMNNATQLENKSVVGVAANGGVVLAATAEYTDMAGSSVGYGLYRSVDGGQFTLVPTNQVPSGFATSLAGSGTATNPYVVAIAGGGVFRSSDNATSWQPVPGLTLAAGQAAKVAVSPNGAIAVAVYQGGQVSGLWLAPNGTNWRSLDVPPATPGKQANTDLAFGIDPSNSNVVYVAGDSGGGPSGTMLSAFRVTANPDGGSTVTSITDNNTANGSNSHADARAFAFDAAGRLLVASDGGVYARSNPQSDNGIWTGMNTKGLAIRESYAVAYDSQSKRLVVAAQDNGTTFQDLPRQSGYTALLGADGINAAVNDKTMTGRSIVYSTVQSFSAFSRYEVNASGAMPSAKQLALDPYVEFDSSGKPMNARGLNFVQATKGKETDYTDVERDGFTVPFSSRLVLNRLNPEQIAIGTNYVYTTSDTSLQTQDEPLKVRSTFIGGISALAYGAGTDPGGVSALVAGAGPAPDTSVGRLYFTQDALKSNVAQLSKYDGGTPSSIVFDPRTWQRFYTADGAQVHQAVNDGSDFKFSQPLNESLSAIGLERPTAVEFISSNKVNALLVGGIRKNEASKSPIAVAVSNDAGTLEAALPFGSALPNTMVNLLTYNPQVDVLAVGLWGRGIWTLYDVTSYFPTAEKLIYGLANNDSKPDKYYLSNGSWTRRPLEKYGTGTLSINDKAEYTGSTTVFAGTMAVNGSIASSSGLTVNPGAMVTGGGFLPATTIAGQIAPGFLNNAPTTARIATSYTQATNSSYNVFVSAAGNDQIAVAGPAALAGGTVTAQVVSGTFAPRNTYTIVNAGGGIAGAFAGASLAYPFLQPSLSYDANNAYLTLTVGGFAAAAQNPVQAAVGSALDASVWQASGDYAAVLSSLALLNTSQAQPLLTALSGMNYSGLSNSIVQGAQLFMSNFQAQAGGNTRQGNRIALAAACDTACDKTQPSLWGAWGGAQGGIGTVGASQPLGGVTYNLGGFAGGFDRRFGENLLAGVAVGYTSGTQWVSGFTGQSSTNTVQFGLYGSYTQGPAYLDGLAGYAYTGSQTSRSIVVPGLSPRTAVGIAGVNQLFSQVEGGWRFDIGTAAQAYVTPFARLQAYAGMQGAFTENGAQSLNLSVAAQNTYSLNTVFGAQLGGSMNLGWRDRLAAQLRLGWSHEYADTSRPVTATLAGAPATPFTTYGVSPSRDGVLLGLSASTALSDATSAYFRYEGLMAGQDSSHALTAGVRLTW